MHRFHFLEISRETVLFFGLYAYFPPKEIFINLFCSRKIIFFNNNVLNF